MRGQITAEVLILFDIDGTLLLTDGAGRTAFRHALQQVYGTTGSLSGYQFHGKTDPQIVMELMASVGLAVHEVEKRLDELWPLYVRRLALELDLRRRAGRITVLPGVPALLAALERRGDVVLGLLTGNVEPAARLKLAAAGIATAFAVGGFGSDSPVRAEIARVAVSRARAVHGGALDAIGIVVVGDTPYDVACARAVGGRAVAVATGRHTAAELTAAGADEVFDDFRDTARVLAGILGAGTSLGDGPLETTADR